MITENGGETPSYKQNWPAYNQAKQSEKLTLLALLDELTALCLEERPQKQRGRPANSLRDKVFYAVLQAYNQKASRRTISYLLLAKHLGYVDKVPHFNTLLGGLRNAKLGIVLQKLVTLSALPLKAMEEHFAVDSSGWSTTRYGRWFDVRTGSDSKKRQYIKAHVSVGATTNVIASIRITPYNVHDTNPFPELVRETADYFDVKEVSADKAYLSDFNLSLVEELGAVPYIPFKSNNKPGKWGGTASRGRTSKSRIWKQMLLLFTYRPEEFSQHYHKRSNVETSFHMLKLVFGGTLRSKTYESQQNELLAKALTHNLCVLAQEAAETGINLYKENVQETLLAHKITI
ncbi:MAG: transposase [Candidatus Woesearchaeota archaeon]